MKARMIAAAVVTVLGAAGAMVLTGSAAAVAAPGTGDARHCVVNLDTRAAACAPAPGEARALADAGVAALTIAIMYDGTGYGGASVSFVQSRQCTASYDNEWQWDDLSNVPGWGNWNNRISSVRTYNRCDVKFYDGIDFGGAASTWIDASSNLATVGSGWSNRAGSVKFS